MLALSNCSSIGGSQAATPTVPLDSAQLAAIRSAQAAVDRARSAGGAAPAPAPRPAISDKKIAIVTLSTDESGAVPIAGIEAAAKAIGWSTTVFNANHDIAQVSALVRRAVSAGYAGIVPVVIDCGFAANAFQEAKAQGVVVIPVNAVDCDDPMSPAKGESGFSAEIPTAAGNTDAFWKQAGIDAANKVIADSGNQARVITVVDPELGILNAMTEGFRETIAAYKGSEIVETVSFTTPDYTSGKLTTMIQTALSKHPDATYVKSPFTAATAQYVVPAVTASHCGVKVIGGEGLPSELGLIRSGKVLSTTSLPGQWLGWAVIDTFNSVFSGQPPVNSGLTWVTVDKDNVPDGDAIAANVDYESVYRQAWGRS